MDLACILDEEDNCESAAEVKCTLDNLIAAYNARLDLESNYGKKWGDVTSRRIFKNINRTNINNREKNIFRQQFPELFYFHIERQSYT